MEKDILLMLTIAIVIILIGIACSIIMKKKKQMDYHNLFIIGIIWVVIGLPFDNYILWALGLVFVVIGLINKKKWEKNKEKWKNLDNDEKKLKLCIMFVIILLVCAGIIAFRVMN